jgi:hypothetical protein
MTDQKILEKVIKKAIEGGFDETDMGDEISDVEDVYYYFADDCGYLAINNLIWRHDFAQALWGEHQEPIYNQHDAPAYRKEFKPWDNEFSIDYGGWAKIPEELYKCANDCGKRITSASCRDDCQLLVAYNEGWQSHLMKMVISEDPIKYLGDTT